MKTDIQKIGGKFQVVLIQGNQSFSICQPCKKKKKAKVFKEMVDIAIDKYCKQIMAITLQYYLGL